MKILVCFKVARDLESAMKSDFQRASEPSFDVTYTKKALGLYDEAALEAALRLRDISGEAELIAATVAGSMDISSFARTLFAVGFDRVIRLDDETDLRFSPTRAATHMANFARDENFDLILTGMRAAPGNSGLFPAKLAGVLSFIYVPDSTELSISDGAVHVTRETDAGLATLKLTAPAVVAMGNAIHSYLRPATLKAKRAVASKEIEVLPSEVIDVMGDPALTGFVCPDRSRASIRREKDELWRVIERFIGGDGA